MLSFHNDPAVKAKYLSRVAAHAAADRLIQGTEWSDGKGCAVGCTLEAYDHELYPAELGLPVWLAHLEDRIFEGLPKEDAMTWPVRFLEAIPVGVDLENVRHKLAIRRLDRLIAIQEKLHSENHQHGVTEAVAAVLKSMRVVRSCHEAEMAGSSCDWSAASASASAAAWSARSAAAEASASASASAAAWSARSAAAEASASAAWSAAEAASAAWSARSAAAAAAEAYQKEASDLLDLLSQAK